MVDQKIIQEILDKDKLIRQEYSETDDFNIYTKNKMRLFKAYLGYKKEFVTFFIKRSGCFGYGIKYECPNVACSTCKRHNMYQMIEKEINHFLV